MATRTSLTPDSIVEAAVTYVDNHGLDALTLRSLGQELGAHHTAIYRHFRSKDELFLAMYENVLQSVALELRDSPREPADRIRKVALLFRRALHLHPSLVVLMASTRQPEASYSLQNQITSDLRELGVVESKLAATYQVLESYVFGSTLFDYVDAPQHISLRRERYAGSGDPVFVGVAGSDDAIDEHNELAFALGLDLILAGILAEKPKNT